MDFAPFTEEEIEKERNAPREAGVYDFECIECVYGESKSSGNPQFTVKLKCYDRNGSTFTVWDYLQPEGKIRYKLKHFCDAVGLTKQFEKGSLAEFNLINKSGKVELKIQRGNAEFPNDKNTVSDYLSRTNLLGESTISQDFTNDTIPF